MAGLVALVAYLLRIAVTPIGFGHTDVAYFNLLADALLHGQLHLRLPPEATVDLVYYHDKIYLYWSPLPAILLMPLVALFGVAVSDTLYTAIIGALTIALVARILGALHSAGIAPLSRERRGLLVTTIAFGSVVVILATRGTVWTTAQIIGWCCVLCATLAALAVRGHWGYFLAGLALACGTATRTGLLFNGLWLAYYLLRRDWQHPSIRRAAAIAAGLTPVVFGLGLLGWYNAARFGGNPLETGIAWHNMSDQFRDDFARYGAFNLHYLPTNLYHHFLAPPMTLSQKGTGGGFFWMTPVLIGGLYAIWRDRRDPLTWALVLSCLLVYIPIGLVMGTGYLFGPRYLLDLLVPLVVLTARGIRDWRPDVLRLLLIVSMTTYVLGSALLLWFDYAA